MGKRRGPFPAPSDNVFGNFAGNPYPNQDTPPRSRFNSSSMSRSRGSFTFYCCCCWGCCSFLFFFLLFITSFTIMVACLNPKVPSYDIDNLSFLALDRFTVDNQTTRLHMKLNISITSTNSNNKIGVMYGENSTARLSYRDVELCNGTLPVFYQGHRNVTTMWILMEGNNTMKPEVQERLKEDRRDGEIALNLNMTVAMQLRVFEMDSRTIPMKVKAAFVVDNVDPGNMTEVKKSEFEAHW